MLESMHLAVTLHPTDIINQDAKRKEAALNCHTLWHLFIYSSWCGGAMQRGCQCLHAVSVSFHTGTTML